MDYLLVAALLPVFLLCCFIYKKDAHKEPKDLLAKLFAFGCLIVVPVLFFEKFLGKFFSTKEIFNFFILFINVFIAVGMVEEGFKWLVVKLLGYNNHEFDEVYDIIVYSVFVSLGFACIENILYVFSFGFVTAIMRALTAVPGHTCFAVIMGYFLSKAKVNEINGNNSLAIRNLLLSFFVPITVHSFYDAILLYAENVDSFVFIVGFFLFVIITYVICFKIVNYISKVQSIITQNVESGNIVYNQGSVSMNTAQINFNATQQISVINKQDNIELNFCPICGKPVKGSNFCGFCGYKLRQ